MIAVSFLIITGRRRGSEVFWLVRLVTPTSHCRQGIIVVDIRSARMRVLSAIDSSIGQMLSVVVTGLSVRLARRSAHFAIDCMIDQVLWLMKVELVCGSEFCNPFMGAEQVQDLLAQL